MQNTILEELNEIKSLITQNINKKYLDMRQLIEYTSLSSSTIHRNIRMGTLKASHRTGGKLLFSKENIEKWLNG